MGVLLLAAHFATFSAVWLTGYWIAHRKRADWGVAGVMGIGYFAARIGYDVADWLVPGAW